jgi:uncharacterized ParB-like nuclease family protein
MSIVGRIGKWTSKAALEEALQQVGDDDPVMVVSISRTDQQMRYWTANCNNMEANWMADNIKDDVMGGRL